MGPPLKCQLTLLAKEKQREKDLKEKEIKGSVSTAMNMGTLQVNAQIQQNAISAGKRAIQKQTAGATLRRKGIQKDNKAATSTIKTHTPIFI